MMTPKISIIVPVYNGAATIERTLASILKQSLTDIEVIVVDDGSTDHTVALLTAIEDPKLRVIAKQNGGVSSARNVGIKAAKGMFIGFVDADDEVKEDFYEQLYRVSNEVDVVLSGLLIEKEGNFVQKDSLLEFNRIYSQDDFKKEVLVRYLSLENLDLLVVMNKIYRRSFLLDQAIFFDENLALEEDGMFNLKVYTTMQSLIQIDYAGYCYLDNEISVTRDFIGSNSLDKLIYKFNLEYKKTFNLEFSEEQILTFKSSRLIYSICFLLFRVSKAKMTLTDRNAYITRVMNEPVVLFAVRHLDDHYVQQRSKFERIIAWCILKNKITLVKGMITLLAIADQMKLLQLIKKIN
ncbi:glycosyltransferase involved in cell wall biosynthesis [Myroides gitamensis]|uniref:glycosyltransferase family 2 protein n=1 Tax=Myroides odoratus TaxID=256 RepID=UPI002168C6E5|nr:glycosyltransferase [Myroides odoratus]MCS4239287.1 glycosyltransferase involved in cell wall biosynthesis [Myroides odoratus]MDH6602332.1 glycosyltransferase involved in cell wall biosynthesis [Myroides gitamensis]